MFIGGEALSAHSVRPRKMPGWIVSVRERFSVNKRVSRQQTIESVLKWYYDQKIISFLSSDFESVFA